MQGHDIPEARRFLAHLQAPIDENRQALPRHWNAETQWESGPLRRRRDGLTIERSILSRGATRDPVRRFLHSARHRPLMFRPHRPDSSGKGAGSGQPDQPPDRNRVPGTAAASSRRLSPASSCIAHREGVGSETRRSWTVIEIASGLAPFLFGIARLVFFALKLARGVLEFALFKTFQMFLQSIVEYHRLPPGGTLRLGHPRDDVSGRHRIGITMISAHEATSSEPHRRTTLQAH